MDSKAKSRAIASRDQIWEELKSHYDELKRTSDRIETTVKDATGKTAVLNVTQGDFCIFMACLNWVLAEIEFSKAEALEGESATEDNTVDDPQA